MEMTSNGMQCVELPHSQLTIRDIGMSDFSESLLSVITLRIISALINFAMSRDNFSDSSVCCVAMARDRDNAFCMVLIFFILL
jgi:hypothetical protein